MTTARTRRFLLGALTLAPASILATTTFAPVALAANGAESFIRQSGHKLVGIVNSSKPHKQKAEELRSLINQIVAVDDIGRFVLGRYWHSASPAQRKEYMKLFHQLLAYNITTQIKAYQGVTFHVTGTKSGSEGEMVQTVIKRPNQQPANVEWVVKSVSGQPKIIDVVVAGTSLRITERSDYASVINDNGGQVSALLQAMKHQLHKMQQAG